MLFNLTPELLIANLIALGVGMTIHEFAHNYVGYLMGDENPRIQGRLTLNPLVHINWVGWLMFAIIGFGILGSAPISPERMGYRRLGLRFGRRWGYMLAVAAGPVSNLILAIIIGILMRIIGLQNLFQWPSLIFTIFVQTVYLNIILFLFNLIPLFPLDGWHIVLALLPPELAYSWQRHMQTSQLVFFGLILLSFTRIPGLDLLNVVISQPAIRLLSLILGRNLFGF